MICKLLIIFKCIKLFNNYYQVDLMLGSYMEDIGISSDQFEMACQMSKDNIGGLPVHFHQRLFEQIWAANDYNMFIRMMTQRNIELQLQVKIRKSIPIIYEQLLSFKLINITLLRL